MLSLAMVYDGHWCLLWMVGVSRGVGDPREDLTNCQSVPGPSLVQPDHTALSYCSWTWCPGIAGVVVVGTRRWRPSENISSEVAGQSCQLSEPLLGCHSGSGSAGSCWW